MPLTGRVILALAGAALLLSAPAPGQAYQDAATAAGIAIPASLASYLGRGACWGDFDNDGDQDLVFPVGGGLPILYYRNNGGGMFTDLTGTAGLDASPTTPHACIAGDIDNDGDLDVFLAAQYGSNHLYINDGTGAFTNEAAARGVDALLTNAFSASFGDYDRDGWVDLYVGNYVSAAGSGEANQLFRNIGSGYFVDVTATAGVGNTGLCFTGVFHDYDDDGWPDIFVGNDKGWYPGQQPDTTYMNNRNGTFTNVGVAINTQFAIGAMGSDFTDAFNDGGWDIFVSNTSAGHLFHVWNPNTLQYDELAVNYGVQANIDGWAVNWMDYDNDGWQDLHIVHASLPNFMYRNPGPGGGAWTNMAPSLGCDIGGSIKYVSAIADYDNDGNIDILLPRPGNTAILLRNTLNGGSWIRIALQGTTSNRSGIGARVSVTVGNVTTSQALRTGHGYLSGHDLRLHYGLGTATVADEVRITWPSGQTQIVNGLAANQDHLIIEPSLAASAMPIPGVTINLLVNSPMEPSAPFFTGVAGSATTGFPLSDGRFVPIDMDALFGLTTTPGNFIMPAPNGTLDVTGFGSIALTVPPIPSLTGLTVYAAAAIGNPSAPLGVSSILGPTPITVQ
ncbi:MAG: CRTAC1 family protein [Planctomycetes bacterium]|nr:CRTAC1 family protein [Planctomycetota bacterium]